MNIIAFSNLFVDNEMTKIQISFQCELDNYAKLIILKIL